MNNSLPKYEVVRSGQHYVGISRDGETLFMPQVVSDITYYQQQWSREYKAVEQLKARVSELENLLMIKEQGR